MSKEGHNHIFLLLQMRVLGSDSGFLQICRIVLVACGIASSSSFVVYGQSDTLTLDQALDIARSQNLTIAVAEAGVRKSQSRVDEVRLVRYPSLSFRSHYLYAPLPGYNEVVTNAGEYGVQLAAQVPIYDGGIRSALIDQAANDVERSKVSAGKVRVEIGYAVRSSYYEVLRAAGELRIRGETLLRLKEYGLLLERLQRGGIAGQSDVLKAQVDQNNAAIALDGARQSLQKAKLSLNNVLGRPLATPVEVTDAVSEDSLSDFEFAIENNADAKLAAHDETSASLDLSIGQSERLPTLSIVGDAGFLGVHPADFHQDRGFSVLLSLELPLVTWGGISDRIEQKEIALDQVKLQRTLLRRELEEQWRISISDLEISRKNLVAYRGNAIQAANNYLSAKSRFAGGTGSNLEVLEAQRLLMETKLNENSMIYQIRTALANLLRLSGQP